MRSWREDTPAFEIIRALAKLRRTSGAVAEGGYATLHADGDLLVFERRHGSEAALVAVNRGPAATVRLASRPADLPPGRHTGVLAGTSPQNRDNSLTVTGGSAVLRLGPLSALVVPSP